MDSAIAQVPAVELVTAVRLTQKSYDKSQQARVASTLIAVKRDELAQDTPGK